MANYNPHQPDIVGQEWVPIIDGSYQPDITQERGYSFSLSKRSGDAPIVANRGRYVLSNVPAGVTTSQVPFMALYNKGDEIDGPILKVVLDCSDAVSTGTGSFFGGATGSLALRSPSDGSGYSFSNGSPPLSGTLELAFDMASLPSAVGRVYNVSLLYSASGDGLQYASPPNSMLISLRYRSTDFYYSTGALEGGPSTRGDLNKVSHISLGEINPNWSNATFQGTNDRYPWTSTRLQLFSQVSGDPMRIRFSFSSPNTDTNLSLTYAALEITYSPFENRLLYGGRHIGIDQAATAGPASYDAGGGDNNFVILRTSGTLATGTGTELQPGEYTVTFNLADYGDANQPIFYVNAAAATNSRPTLAATRELYDIPPIQGVEIDRVLSLTDTMRQTSTHLIPSIGIAATGTYQPSGGDVITGMHGYYGPLEGDAVFIATPSQVFQSSNGNGTQSYTYIRFYARQVSGDTTSTAAQLIASMSSPVSTTASISAADLNALPEIFDGWREVTLRWSVPVPFDNTSVNRTIQWNINQASLDTFSAFQVLGEGTTVRFASAKYQGTLTNTTKATFPLSTGALGDYTFLYSTDPPTVSGVAVTSASVALTGIGTECSSAPQCIPTSAPYNRITWTVPSNTATIFDTFDRTVFNGWGTSTSGQAWTTVGGSASDYYVTVSGSSGVQSLAATNTPHTSLIGSSTLGDFDITVDVKLPNANPSGASIITSVVGRWVDANNYYEFRFEWTTAGGSRPGLLYIQRVIGGVALVISNTQIAPFAPSTGDTIRIRAMAESGALKMMAWDISDSDPVPNTWQVTASDTTLTQGQVGVRSTLNSGNTNTLPVIINWDSFNVRPPSDNFGYYELQRMDDDTPWQTIMKATSPEVSGFSDFEARIGMRSDYRIRIANVYEFTGSWSVTVSNTLPSPVTGTGADGHELLVFTSNTDQTLGRSLAYEEVWDGNPVDDMSYFEGNGMMQFQRMYRRNFQVGFHSLERGGVQFERTLLVQNAAVPPPILENAFQSLRDMAWAALPYVCVRTNLGDRWYMTVEVPSGTISRNRRLQLVQVKCTENADEPYPVDPSGVPRAF